MFGPSLIVLLATWCTVSSAQTVVTQEPSMSASPGQTVKFSCSMSSAAVTNYYQSWYQQKPGSPPRLLYYYYSSARAGSGDVSRFSASKESSRNTWYLTISNVQAVDEAYYYCAVWYGSESRLIFGGGTQLSVLGQPTVPPTVNVFPPSQAELRSSEKATLVCLIDGFYPGSAQVTWLADGTTISSGVQTTKPAKLNDKYAASSYLSMEKSAWERCESVSCKVEHEGKTFEKQVRRSECA